MNDTYDFLRNIKNFNTTIKIVSQFYFHFVLFSEFIIDINYIIIIKINKKWSNIEVRVDFLVYVEEWKNLWEILTRVWMFLTVVS